MHRYCRELLFLALIVNTAWAQDTDPASDHGGWKAYFQKVATQYSIVADDDAEPFKVTEKPVQSFYSGGASEYNHGTFFIWSHLGQAKAIGELWCYGSVSRGPQPPFMRCTHFQIVRSARANRQMTKTNFGNQDGQA